MATYKSMSQYFKKLQRDVDSAKSRASNKALTSTRALYAKKVSEELGIASKRVKARARLTKATRSNRLTSLSIGVKFQFAAHDFRTSSKSVSTRLGRRRMAQYSTKRGAKTPLPGSFVTNVNSKYGTHKLVLQRQGAGRYPLKTTTVNDFRPYVESIRPELIKNLRDKMSANFNSELKYQLTRKTTGPSS